MQIIDKICCKTICECSDSPKIEIGGVVVKINFRLSTEKENKKVSVVDLEAMPAVPEKIQKSEGGGVLAGCQRGFFLLEIKRRRWYTDVRIIMADK